MHLHTAHGAHHHARNARGHCGNDTTCHQRSSTLFFALTRYRYLITPLIGFAVLALAIGLRPKTSKIVRKTL